MPQLRTTNLDGPPERRSTARQKMVLRVGLLQAGGRTSFCLVKNISPSGVQVKVYGDYDPGAAISLTVGDESPLLGRLKWVRAPLAGIQFDDLLPPSRLLRVAQKLSPSRRRSSPRASLAAQVVLTLEGRTLWGELCDISTTGARVRTRRKVAANSNIMLRVAGMPPLKAFVRWSDGDEIGLAFAAPIPIEIIAGWLAQHQLSCA